MQNTALYKDPSAGFLSTRFNRPVTTTALRNFDPDLDLRWNKAAREFQLYRRVCMSTRYDVGGETIVIPEVALYWVCPWNRERFGTDPEGDQPWQLIGHLMESDTMRVPGLCDRQTDEVMEQQARARGHIHGQYQHAMRMNRRQLLKHFQPVFDFPRLVN